MKASALTRPCDFSETQKNALLSLLTDEDPAVFSQIRNAIVATGPKAADWLRPHTLSADPVLRRRTQSIIRQFESHAADNEFVAFCLSTGQDLPLETGTWLLARTAWPDINVSGYTALLDHMASELRLRIGDLSDSRQALHGMRLYLFDELNFRGNEDDYYDPDNSYLNRVLDRRLGNPISLCTVYMLLARRLKLPITGLGLPGHFICRYQTSAVEVYIDVFRGGKLLTKGDCIRYLQEGQFGLSEEYLSPVSSRRILLRICGNLHQVYSQSQQPEEATRLRRYMVALSR
jgi:regulator of sirC expression with transglutaminase-like and TPR domain